jgi:hypothetical protein
MITKRIAIPGRLPAGLPEAAALPTSGRGAARLRPSLASVNALVVPVAWGALLLVPAGVAKVTRPASTERALRAVGWPDGRSIGRVLGVVEVVVAVVALVWSAAVAPALQAALYAGFTLFVLLALWRGTPLQSCGCFGAADSPPSLVHVGVCAGLAVTNALAASDHVASPLAVIRDGGGDAVLLVILTFGGAATLYALLTRRAGTGIANPSRTRSGSSQR